MNKLNRFIAALKRFRAIYKKQPCIVVSRSGWLTPKPKIHLGIHSRGGMMGIFTEDDTIQGNALMDLHLMSFKHHLDIPVIDERTWNA